ncbi:MAG: radical SAM protein [Treponema sp.]|nr:radical SAM protein [Treponema sp.]MCL2237696.1 radical SAM protein [Treponema sp.]
MANPYLSCKLCPRNCGINRLNGEIGYCGETAHLRIATAVIHKGEEPVLVGTGGSGTIFISGCNLGCVFCQNYQISQGAGKEQALGKAVTPEEFAGICAALRDAGAENINIVTGSHAVPGIIEGICAARKAGVQLPVLWNSSGYDGIEALELLGEHVDIYLPDMKTLDSKVSAEFFNAPDYPQTAKAAILKMIDNMEKKHENARERIIVRHLILPGFLESTRSVLKWFADNAMEHATLSLMTQYTPVLGLSPGHSPGRSPKIPKRYVSESDYETVMKWLEEFGIEEGFCQELVTGSDWLPDFKRSNPFPSKLSVPVWTGN